MALPDAASTIFPSKYTVSHQYYSKWILHIMGPLPDFTNTSMRNYILIQLTCKKSFGTHPTGK
jgi:hypothetical protein